MGQADKFSKKYKTKQNGGNDRRERQLKGKKISLKEIFIQNIKQRETLEQGTRVR